MEYLLVAVLLYFILRTVSNLIAFLSGRESGSPTSEQRSHSSRIEWKGPSPRQQTGDAREGPTSWGKDIEDATWRDL